MDRQPDTLQEAVGVFTSANDLQEAIDELQSSGFHRAELSLLANEESVERKCCWRGLVANSSRSGSAALIIAVHSLRDSWSTARSDVRGIMLVLT